MLDEIIEERIRKKKKEEEIHRIIRISTYISLIAVIFLLISLSLMIPTKHCLNDKDISKAREAYNNGVINDNELNEILNDYNNNKCNVSKSILKKINQI